MPAPVTTGALPPASAGAGVLPPFQPPAVPVPVAGASGGVLQEQGDLEAAVEAFTSATALPAARQYLIPAPAEVEQLRRAWAAIVAGDLRTAQQLAAPLKFDVVRFTDTVNGREVVLLRERRNPDGSWPRGWGMYVWWGGGRSSTVVEVPHPWDDEHSDSLGVRVWRSAGAGALLIAGASRKATPDGQADMAHATGTAFDAIHRNQLVSGALVVQLHGFQAAKHPGYGEAVLSEGAAPAGLAPAVASQLTGFDVRVYDGARYGALGATTNAQGSSTRAAGARFLHVEAERVIRYDERRRHQFAMALAAAIVAAQSGWQQQ